MSKYVWALKDKNIDFKVFFHKLVRGKIYSKETKKCSLCTLEKLNIMKFMKDHSSRILNRREELFNKCIHRRKHLLGAVPRINPPTIEQLKETISEDLEIMQDNNIDISRQVGQNHDMTFGATRSGRCWREGSNLRQHDPG